jgi:hypothetical protein
MGDLLQRRFVEHRQELPRFAGPHGRRAHRMPRQRDHRGRRQAFPAHVADHDR